MVYRRRICQTHAAAVAASVCLAFLLISALPTHAAGADRQALIEGAHRGVVRVLVETDRWTTCGSGVIISTDGHILTAAHVLEGAQQIVVVVEGRRDHQAELMATHPHTDVALLKINAPDLSPLPIGRPDSTQPNEYIVVLGYPDCHPALVAAHGHLGATTVTTDTLWYDAPIRRGHSGGPVLNARGEVVAIHFEQPAAEGGGRGIKIDTALSLVPTGTVLEFLYPRRLTAPSIPVHTTAFSPCGSLLAVGADDGAVFVWDLPTGRLVHSLRGHTGPIWDMAFGPEGAVLLSVSGDGTGSIWDMSTGAQRSVIPSNGAPLLAAAFSPSGDVVAIGSWSGAVSLWNPVSADQVATLHRHGAPVRAVAFTPDGEQLASGAADGTVTLWMVADRRRTGELRSPSSGVENIAFSTDGTQLALLCADGTATLWPLDKPDEPLASMSHGGCAHHVTFIDGEAVLITAFADSPLELQVVTSGDMIKTVDVDPPQLAAFAVNAHSRLLAATAADGTITLYPIPPT